MIFSLDFDGTYTAAPDMWERWIEMVTALGHEVYCISYRPINEMQKVYETLGKVIGVDHCISTRATPKKRYTEKLGLHIDVWIDDTPEMLIDDRQYHKWKNTPYK